MKKYITSAVLILMITSILSGCKKDNANDAKDPSDSIAGKTWWGKFAYTGKLPQYYSITFSPSGRHIQADISEDGKLINIENNSTYGYSIQLL